MKIRFKDFLNESADGQIQSIGTFEIESGKIIVSDPCYEDKGGNHWQALLENVLKGKWHALIEEDGGSFRVAQLIAIHSDYELDDMNWQEYPNRIGVDSGQAGIYDLKYYADDSCVGSDKIYHKETKRINKTRVRVVQHDFALMQTESGDLWYDANCNLTHSIKNDPGDYDEKEIEYHQGGCLKYGCISSSGYGDGSYVCLYARIPEERKFIDEDPYGEEIWEEKSPIIGINIIFIMEEE